jgi:hypothetical protein
MVTQNMPLLLGKERNTCALFGDFNGCLATAEPGAGPVILDTLCSEGWLPFLHTALRTTALHPICTFWCTTVCTRTCPVHAFVRANCEEMLMPSGAYVLEGLMSPSDGHHVIGVAFQVTDGPIPAEMRWSKHHHTHKRQPPARPGHVSKQIWNDTRLCYRSGSVRNLRWIMTIYLQQMRERQ